MIYTVKAEDIEGEKVTLIVKVTGSDKYTVKRLVSEAGLFIKNLDKDIKAIRIKEGIIFKNNK